MTTGKLQQLYQSKVIVIIYRNNLKEFMRYSNFVKTPFEKAHSKISHDYMVIEIQSQTFKTVH